MARELDGKSIIVTGGGGGIGRAACLVLAAAGARLVVSDIADDNGEGTVGAVRSEGGEAVYLRADLASEDGVRRLVDQAVARYGRLDGAFNNAGLEQRNKPLVELTLAEWENAIRIDLTAVFLCIKYQVPAMLSTAGRGSIVNTASSLGQVAIANAGEYVTAKHGVIGLTRAAGAEYSAKGVRVNAILPGITRTPMIARLSEEPSFAGMFDRLRARHPIGRFGEPSEIGEAAKWLLSDVSSFVNGAAIPVDGGFLSI